MLDMQRSDRATDEDGILEQQDVVSSAVDWRSRLHAVPGALWRWRIRVPAALAILGALWYYGVPLLFGPLVDTTSVVRANFVQSVVASGHVEAPYRVNIASQITGVVAEVPVEEGQSVKAGDALVMLDDREARAVVAQNEGAVAQAEARLRQLRELTLPAAKETLNQAQATLVNAQKSYDRAAKLASDGYGTKVALDDATRAVDIARAQVRTGEFQVFTSSPGGSDYVMAETQLNQARANLLSAQSRWSYTVLKAPRGGVLISRNVERGAVVQPTNVLMALSPFGESQIVVQIDEKNLAVIAIGQKALASADAFPKQTFAAEIVYINPAIDLQRASVEVKLRVPEPPAYLRQDMTVSVDIETARHPGALVLPVGSIRGLASGRPWVLKVNAARAVQSPVDVGIVSAGNAEILVGLSEGDLIVPPSATGIVAGRRIRARAALAPSP